MRAYVGTMRAKPYQTGDTLSGMRSVVAIENAESVTSVVLRFRNPSASAANCRTPHARKKAWVINVRPRLMMMTAGMAIAGLTLRNSHAMTTIAAIPAMDATM